MTKIQKSYYVYKWLFITSIRVITGRWFIFKDSPKAIIRYFSLFGHTYIHPQDPNIGTRIYSEARQESNTRFLKNKTNQ